MTSLTGTTERCAPQRSPKCVVADSRTCYTGDSWYGTAGGEGGGSLPGSSGSPSPGSGISSPGSYGGSPASETRAGICTGSPGSLGGSPGFGTGSPGVWCENCNARLVELKRQALQLLIPGTFSSKDPSFPAMLNDKLQVPDSTRKAWNERDARCEVCATHISQLKQEAVYMVLSLEQAASLEPGPPPSIPSLPALVGSRNIQPGPRDRGSFAKHVSPGSAGKPGTGCNTTVAPSILSSVALQAHHYLESSWSVSRTNGVTLYPCQNLQAPPLLPEASRDGPNEAAESCAKAERASQRPPQAPTASAQSSMTSAAASFFARAAQKLNLNSKRKKVRLLPAQPAEARVPHPFPTNYCSILHTTPPPAPPCLLRSLSKVKDTPGLGKVKVMLRVSPLGTVEPHSFLKVDPRKKQVTITDLAATAPQGACRFQKRGGNSRAPPKTFFFDAVFPHDTSQAEVCAGSVAEVIQCVVNGADGCIFCFGQAKLGKSYTMIGKDDSMQTLGIIPCAISWLFKLIGERKDKMGTRFSIRVSAVEVSGRDEVLKDLLSEVATGSLQDGQSPAIHLCEDPVCGTQLHNQSELRAPTAEKAAYYLDAAIAARIKTDPDSDEEEQCNSHMLFTLHVYQYRAEKTGKLGMSGGRSRLHLIDLGSCVKVLSKTRDGSAGLCLSLSALGNVILALVNGSKHIPYKESKLTMLLRESLGNINCRTTMIAHISPSPSHFSETLSTIQIASRILRMKKKKTKQHTSSSSGGESSCEEGRMRRPTHLRAFHSQRLNDPDMTLIHVSSDPDEHSSSEQSCDTVIYVGPNGSTLSDRELTDNEGPPECLPIMSSLKSMVDKEQTIQTSHGLQPEHKLQDSNSSPKDKPEVDWFKCNTFAQLQERLGCIDGSEEVNIFPFEEHLDSRNPKESMATTVQDASDKNQEVQNGKDTCCDQQLMDIQELVAEAVMTQSMIQSLSYSVANSSNLSTGRYVMGGNTVPGTYTQKKMSTDVLCNIESTSTGHIDSKPRTTGSPRLGIASLTKTSDYKLMSSSQRCKVYTQMGIMPTITYMSTGCLTKEIENSSAEFLLQKEKRTSPIGMGSQVLTRSSSCSSLCSSHRENEHQPATPSRTAVSCCSTLTVQQMGVDDQVSVKELKEITIRGITEDEGSTSELSFDSHCSVQALASRSRPVSSVSSISENKNGFHIYSYNNPHANSEISFSQFRLLSAEEDQPDKCSSISSWLNQMSISTNGRKPFCTFSVQEENLKLNDKKTTESEPSTTVKCIISNVQACGEPKSTLRTNITFHSCSSPEIMQDVLQASPSKRKVPIPICSKKKFDDPWLIKYNDDIKHSEHTDGVNSNCQNRVVDGCEISMNVPKSLNDTVKGGSLPRICHHLESSHYYTGEHRGLLATSSTPCSPRSTLDRQESSEKDKGMPHVPPTRKSRQDQRSPTCGNTVPSQTLPRLRGTLDDSANGKLKRSSVESSRLFRAKLEQLANRTNSLGRNPGIHYDFLSLGRTSSLSSGDSKESLGKDSSGTKCSPTRTSLSPCNGPVTNKTLHSPKMSGVSKILMGSPKAHSLAASSTKTLSFSTKSLQQSVNRNSSLPPNGNNLMDSWSTQSLSRSRGSGLAARLPLKAVNSRISELLQGSGGSCSSRTQQRHNFGTRAVPEAHILPSPYSKITAPRRPQRCSIGQASDNSSVLSGELPPAMGKTTVFYHSGGSSGYESMMRDSEATCSTSSAQDSMSDNNSSNNGRRGFRSQRKRSNTGSQRRRMIPTLFLETSSPTKKPINGVRWVDSPLRLPQRSLTDSLEIKVYEIDDVERLQRRWGIETKEVVRFSAKMMILDHRQQRISEVQARYDWLKRELAQTKQHLMLSAEKCAPEFDLQQTVEVDSLEYLEALEVVTGQLENCVDFYKAHLMMITCFDVTS